MAKPVHLRIFLATILNTLLGTFSQTPDIYKQAKSKPHLIQHYKNNRYTIHIASFSQTNTCQGKQMFHVKHLSRNFPSIQSKIIAFMT